MSLIRFGGLKMADGVGPLHIVNLRTADGESAQSFTTTTDAMAQASKWQAEHPEMTTTITIYSTELAGE